MKNSVNRLFCVLTVASVVIIAEGEVIGSGRGELNRKERKTFKGESHVGTQIRSMNIRKRELTTEKQGIVGGLAVSDELKYPFFVKGFGCGGTLIHDDVVLTAAHCEGVFWKTVLIGSNNAAGAKNGTSEYVAIKGEMHVHPSFNRNTMEYDFMMFRITPVTKRKLKRALAKKTIQVNTASTIPEDYEWLTTIGYGAVAENGPQSKVLREVAVQYIPNDECNLAYNGIVSTSTQLCAAVEGGGKDSCQGDSGGPILSKGNVLVGIVSWGYGCARAEYPGVYSRVSSAQGWISQTICTISSNPPSSCDNSTSLPSS